LSIVMSKWGVGRTDDHIGRYGWVASSKYLPLGLISKKVKWESLLFDANNTFIWIVATISIWELYVTCVNKSMGNAIPNFFHLIMVMGKWGGLVVLMIRQVGMVGWSSRYLLGCLVGRKVKWWLLFDASNTCIWVVAIIFIWVL
jgi:hypothetical protein